MQRLANKLNILANLLKSRDAKLWVYSRYTIKIARPPCLVTHVDGRGIPDRLLLFKDYQRGGMKDFTITILIDLDIRIRRLTKSAWKILKRRGEKCNLLKI